MTLNERPQIDIKKKESTNHLKITLKIGVIAELFGIYNKKVHSFLLFFDLRSLYNTY